MTEVERRLARDVAGPAAASALPQGPDLREIECDLQYFGDCEFRRGLWEANHRKSSEAHRAESLKFRTSTLDLVLAALARERTAREQAERERDLAARSALANLDHAAEVETQRAAAESTAQRERERAEALAGALRAAETVLARLARAKKVEWDRMFGSLLLSDVDGCHTLVADAKKTAKATRAALSAYEAAKGGRS